MRNLRVFLALVVVISTFAAFATAQSGNEDVEGTTGLAWRHEIDGYVIEAKWDAKMLVQHLEILYQGHQCLLLQGDRFTLGVPTQKIDTWSWAEMPDHFDEKGEARIFVHESFGSAVIDNSTIHVIDLHRELETDRVQLSQSIRMPIGSVWRDLDGDGDLECYMFDESFREWCGADRATSIRPVVVLDDRGQGYAYAIDLMLKPVPTAVEIDMWVHPDCCFVMIYEDMTTDPPTWLTHRPGCAEDGKVEMVVSLIYSGNEKSAWEYYELARANTEPTVEALKADVEEVIRNSPHWPAVLAVNELGRARPVIHTGDESTMGPSSIESDTVLPAP